MSSVAGGRGGVPEWRLRARRFFPDGDVGGPRELLTGMSRSLCSSADQPPAQRPRDRTRASSCQRLTARRWWAVRPPGRGCSSNPAALSHADNVESISPGLRRCSPPSLPASPVQLHHVAAEVLRMALPCHRLIFSLPPGQAWVQRDPRSGGKAPQSADQSEPDEHLEGG
jgi:hypothetical protein